MATHFEEVSSLENASMMVDVLREELCRVGLSEEASKLRGLEVTNQQSAELALLTIEAIPSVQGVQDVRRITVEALINAGGRPFAKAN